ncbi:MAG: FkbM family methyltransferase [Burkholderiales bacterium]|nr:FkbM family methyltransferase [Burkholderiales bacterium]
MNTTTTLTLVDGASIVVPDSLNLITTYVLREQMDWFEDEIKFLRRLLQPGHRVIDIGANYGVYTLSMAKRVGPTGCVWAFEPASSTAKLLAASIAANNFGQVILALSALSSVKGTAQLSLNDNSELNALVHDSKSGGATETVVLSTLDECLETNDWQAIEFLKIDAEGEEGNILLGGKRFFARESPLIQYEIKAGTELHLELVHAFTELGYDSYRLVPGLDLLVPFDEKELADGYLLNLFSCKPDRAAQLADRGFLADTATIRRVRKARSNSVPGDLHSVQTSDPLAALIKFPYGETCADLWREHLAAGKNSGVEAALLLYQQSRDDSSSAAERFVALESAFTGLRTICEAQPAYLRLSSLARVARDYGARSLAVESLLQLYNTILQQGQVDLSEPFLAPGERFESVSPQNAIGNWVAAAALEEFERNCAFSSFYTGASALHRLEIIQELGFGSPEMARRLKLARLRFGKSHS